MDTVKIKYFFTINIVPKISNNSYIFRNKKLFPSSGWSKGHGQVQPYNACLLLAVFECLFTHSHRSDFELLLKTRAGQNAVQVVRTQKFVFRPNSKTKYSFPIIITQWPFFLTIYRMLIYVRVLIKHYRSLCVRL